MKHVIQYLRDLWRRKDLLLYLVTSGLKADTRNTFLGYFWWLLDPALMVVTFLFVRIVLMGSSGENVVAFLATGLVVFQFFSQSLRMSARSITSKGGIITQVYLPKMMFPLGIILTQLINFAFGLIVVGIILLISGIRPGFELLWLPPIILCHMFFQIALGMVMAYAAAFVRDLDRIIGHVIMILRFTAPVIWEVERVPERLNWVLDVNPLAWLLEAYRAVLMYGSTPNILLILVLGLASLLSTVLLMVFYTFREHRIVKVL
jgi:ABC-type polysaccharide/polyol phosphate export permease